MISVQHIACFDVDRVWSMIAHGLDASMRATGGEADQHWLWQMCRSGEAHLFVIADGGDILGASVWTFQKWQTGRKLRCLAIYGTRMAEWLETHENVIKELASLGGANGIVEAGRMGWRRKYPRARVLQVLLELAVEPGENEQRNEADDAGVD